MTTRLNVNILAHELNSVLVIRPNSERRCEKQEKYNRVQQDSDLPTPSIQTLISSPSLNTTFGFLITPTPGGVPVMTTVPLSSVVPWLRNATVCWMVKIISWVFELWTSVPLWVALMPSAYGFEPELLGRALGLTSAGPIGAE